MFRKIVCTFAALALSGCMDAGSGQSRAAMAEQAAIQKIEAEGYFVGQVSFGSRRLIWNDRSNWLYCAHVDGERRPPGWTFPYNDQVSGLVVVSGYGPVAFQARFRPSIFDHRDCQL